MCRMCVAEPLRGRITILKKFWNTFGQGLGSLIFPVIKRRHIKTPENPKERSGQYVASRLSCKGCRSGEIFAIPEMVPWMTAEISLPFRKGYLNNSWSPVRSRLSGPQWSWKNELQNKYSSLLKFAKLPHCSPLQGCTSQSWPVHK